MKKEDIKLSDISRILFGDAPPEFLLEVLVRTIIIYLAFFLIVRWMGKRMNAQLSVIEMIVMLTLGAIIAIPMQAPDKGLIQGIIVIAVAFLYQQGINWWGIKHHGFERLTHGNTRLLIKDGILQLEELKKTRISRRQLFAQLRASNLYNIGKIKRLYLEACGAFGIYQYSDDRVGLSTFPDSDYELLKSQEIVENKCACVNCGNIEDKKNVVKCKNCGENNWTTAIK